MCYQDCKGLLVKKNSSLLGPFVSYKKWTDVNTARGPSFSFLILNGSNKLECYIRLGCKEMAVKNTLA